MDKSVMLIRTMADVTVENLRKVFDVPEGKEIAVDGLDFNIDDGEFVTIVGPSGCGKTTLLRMIAGLETPTDGRILFDNLDVTTLRPQERDISMVFQNIALFPFKTLKENIGYGLKYENISGEEKNAKITQMAEMVGVAEYLDKKPGQLSGGQQQRAALARALVREPEVFLLDEPMSDLDAALKMQLRSELKELHKEFPTTTLYVTHDQEEALTLSDKVIVLNNGQIEQFGTPGSVFHQPENRFVGEFIGSPTMNIFESTIDGSNLSTEIGSIHIGDDIINHLDDHSDYVVGIRPTHLELIDENHQNDSDFVFEAKLNIYEQLGDATILRLITNDTEITAKVDYHIEPDLNETFNLKFNPKQHMYIFNGVGERVYPPNKNSQEEQVVPSP